MKINMLLVVLASLVVEGQVESASMREISIDVTVRDRLGAPVADICVGTASDHSSSVQKTDSAGTAHLHVSVDDLWTGKLYYGILPCRSSAAISIELGDSSVFETLLTSNSYPTFQSVDIVANVSSYAVELSAVGAYSVSGKVVWSDGTACESYVIPMCLSQAQSTVGDAAEFTVDGLPVDREMLTVVQVKDNPLSVHLWTSAPSVGNEVALSPVVVPIYANWKPVEITVSSRSLVGVHQGHPWNASNAISCIAIDGTRHFAFYVNKQNRACRGVSAAPELPPGEYLLVPGVIDGYSGAHRVAELLHSGRLAEVLSASVPKLTVPEEGAVAPCSIDAAEIEARVFAIP